MPRNPLMPSKSPQVKTVDLPKSAGILDDYAVRKNVATREGTIEKVPANNSDIVNKLYCDTNGAFIRKDGTTTTTAEIPFAQSIKIGVGAAGVDYTLTFDGENNDGTITWQEDENYFKVSDDWLMNAAENVYFRDTANYINSSTTNLLNINAGSTIYFDIGGSNEVTIGANVMTFNNGSSDTQINWVYDGTLMFKSGGQEIVYVTENYEALNTSKYLYFYGSTTGNLPTDQGSLQFDADQCSFYTIGKMRTGSYINTTADTNSREDEVANTTTETSFPNHEVTFGEGALVTAGTIIRFKYGGFYSTHSTAGTLTLRLYLDADLVATTVITMKASQTDKAWFWDGDINFHAAGASAETHQVGLVAIEATSAQPHYYKASLDSTGEETLSCTAQWSVANAANTITCDNSRVEILK